MTSVLLPLYWPILDVPLCPDLAVVQNQANTVEATIIVNFLLTLVGKFISPLTQNK